MGYYTYVSGEIRIDPPIPWGKIRDSQFLAGASGDWTAVLVVEEVNEETPDGTLVRKQAVAIAPFMEDRFKAYYLVEHVQAIIDRHGAGRSFTGRFDCYGDDNGDLWRLEIHDGKAVKVQPRIIWPDGEVMAAR